MKSNFRRAVIKIQLIGGLFPNNTSSQHNVGKCKIIAFFLTRIQGVCSSKNHYVEFGAQITTVPDTPDQWSLLINNEPVDLIGENNISMMTRTLCVPLNWGNVCLKYARVPDLEACQDMPAMLTMPITNLMMKFIRSYHIYGESVRSLV